MSRKASKTLIGAFVVGAIVLMVAGLVVFGSGKFFTKKNTFVMYFEGSVRGLTVGAPVVFRGVKIGMVTDIKLRASRKDFTVQIPVFVQVFPDRFEEVDPDQAAREDEDINAEVQQLIKHGLRAQLTIQSFVTAQLMVECDYHPDTPIRLVGTDKTYPEIPTVPSPFQELTKKVKELDVEELYTKVSEALTGFTAFVNSPDLSKSVQTLYLAMEDVRGLIQNIDNRIDPIAVGLEDTIRDTRHLVQRIDSKIDPLQKELSEVDRDIQQLITVIQSRVKRLAASIEKTNKSAVAALSQAEKTLKTVEGVTKEDSPVLYELTRTLQQLSAAARSIRVWADYLERHPEALLRGKGGNTRR